MNKRCLPPKSRQEGCGSPTKAIPFLSTKMKKISSANSLRMSTRQDITNMPGVCGSARRPGHLVDCGNGVTVKFPKLSPPPRRMQRIADEKRVGPTAAPEPVRTQRGLDLGRNRSLLRTDRILPFSHNPSVPRIKKVLSGRVCDLSQPHSSLCKQAISWADRCLMSLALLGLRYQLLHQS